MDQIQAMRIFTRVVEAGTFTRAADSLSLPKATVTKHVQALEERLRVKLLNRTTRRVTVTADASRGTTPPAASTACVRVSPR
jgi:DNA-binding transcriptional LysR family regulator